VKRVTPPCESSVTPPHSPAPLHLLAILLVDFDDDEGVRVADVELHHVAFELDELASI
jgi:hypothetical protein